MKRETEPELIDNLSMICWLTIAGWLFTAGIAYAIHQGINVLLR